MQISLIDLAPFLGVLALASSCIPPKVAAQIDEQQQYIREQKQRDAQQQAEIQRLAGQVENLERAWWSEKFCKPEKGEKGEKNFKFGARIAEFLGQVQASVPEVCTEGSLESSLIFMNSQPYANAYFGRNAGTDSIHVARREQLIDLIAPKYVHPSTRFLVLVQPAEETKDAREAALQFGKKFIDMLQREIAPQRDLRLLGPHLLPCRMRQEVRRLFRSAMDATLFGEPVEGTPRIRVWVFRSDC